MPRRASGMLPSWGTVLAPTSSPLPSRETNAPCCYTLPLLRTLEKRRVLLLIYVSSRFGRLLAPAMRGYSGLLFRVCVCVYPLVCLRAFSPLPKKGHSCANAPCIIARPHTSDLSRTLKTANINDARPVVPWSRLSLVPGPVLRSSCPKILDPKPRVLNRSEGQMPSGEYKAELFFAGDAKPVASISMFHRWL